MYPKIIEYNSELNKITLTEAVFCLPETKAIVDKYGVEGSIPYMGYCYFMSAPDSAYRNQSMGEKEETIAYDVNTTMGDMDPSEPLLDPAIIKLKSLWETATSLFADELEDEVHRWRTYMRDNPLDDENFKNREKIVDKALKIITTLREVRKIADEEQKPDTRGDHELGDY